MTMKYTFQCGVLTLVFLVAILSGCKKSSSNQEVYFFKYTVNGRSGGSTSNQLISANQYYSAMAGPIGLLSASKYGDCNINGGPPCYDASIYLNTLSVGEHSFSTDGNYLWIKENSVTDYWISVPDGVGGGTITLTEVGAVGGVIAGTFRGTAGENTSISIVNISGSFRLPRTR